MISGEVYSAHFTAISARPTTVFNLICSVSPDECLRHLAYFEDSPSLLTSVRLKASVSERLTCPKDERNAVLLQAKI
jgi:hypothetical protein